MLAQWAGIIRDIFDVMRVLIWPEADKLLLRATTSDFHLRPQFYHTVRGQIEIFHRTARIARHG